MMHTHGKNTAGDVHDYYFAENRLQVFHDNGFLRESNLSIFDTEQAYLSESSLSLIFGRCPVFRDLTILSESSGIIVGWIEGERWLFSSSDRNNPCCIVTCDDYATLCGYVDLEHCADKAVLTTHFIQLLRIATECGLAHQNSVSVHASCIAHDSQAVLFIAPSGIGKSTQADIWKSHLGAKIINGDRPLLRVFSKEIRAYGVPWDGKEQIFLQETCPVKAIVEVRRALVNSVRRLSGNQAFKIMMKQSFIPMWDDKAKFCVMKTIRQISQTIPVYRLFCLPEASAAELLNAAIFKNQINLVKREQTDMRIKEGFLLKNLMDEWIVMPTSTNIKQFEGAIVLNDVAAMIWKQLEKPISREDLLQAIVDAFEIDEQTASADMDEMLDRFRCLDILLEN